MSAIDPTKPTAVEPATEDVRRNFQAAADELDDHEGRIADLEAGGGGGGEPKQVIAVGPLDSGEAVVVEHTAIPTTADTATPFAVLVLEAR